MIMTFDFAMLAWKDNELMTKLQNGLVQENENEVLTKYHRIIFYPGVQKIDIFPISESSPFHWKITPKQITYSAFWKMLNKDFEHFEDGDIIDI